MEIHPPKDIVAGVARRGRNSMRRFAFVSLVSLTLAILAGPASACHPCFCPPLPVCCWGYLSPPIVFVPTYVPRAMAALPVPSPKVQISRPRPLTTETNPPAKAEAPAKEPVRAAGFDDLPPMGKPSLPAAPKIEIPPPPMPLTETIPPMKLTPPQELTKPESPWLPSAMVPRTPAVEAPKPEVSALPSLVLPTSPPTVAPKFETPIIASPSVPMPFDDRVPVVPPPVKSVDVSTGPLTLPAIPKSSTKDAVPPPLPELVLPPATATPTPAPAPPEPGQFLPGDAPKLPLPASDLKLSDTGLPPLALPPISAPKVTAQASPLAAVRSVLPRVRTIPVASTTHAAPIGKRKVGIFNYTQSPLELVIEGEKVTLPRRHYLQAEVPASFAWRIGTGELRNVAIPTNQAGLELVIE